MYIQFKHGFIEADQWDGNEDLPVEHIRAIANARERAVGALGDHLAYFVRAAWPILMPGIPLLWNWHLEALCKHVQGMLEEWIKRQLAPGDPITGEGGYQMALQNLVFSSVIIVRSRERSTIGWKSGACGTLDSAEKLASEHAMQHSPCESFAASFIGRAIEG